MITTLGLYYNVLLTHISGSARHYGTAPAPTRQTASQPASLQSQALLTDMVVCMLEAARRPK